MGVHDPCRPGQCARTLQPAEQRRAFQLQLQAWLQTPPPRSAWEVAGVIEEIDEEMASATSVEVRWLRGCTLDLVRALGVRLTLWGRGDRALARGLGLEVGLGLWS